MDKQPLCVDLDGTLVTTNTLLETALFAIKKNPLFVFTLLKAVFTGKATAKHVIGVEFAAAPLSFPYNEDFLAWLTKEHAEGRTLILATASDIQIGSAVSKDLGIFSDVIASSLEESITASNKAGILCKKFGKGNFSYVGNSKSDIAVWKYAKSGIVVHAANKTTQEAAMHTKIEATFEKNKKPILATIIKAMRVHQWAKNTLLLIPAIAAHGLLWPGVAAHALLGFVSFSLLASAVYIFNDIADLPSDRAHTEKKKRPIASSDISLSHALLVGTVSAIASFAIALSALPIRFPLILLAYLGINIYYSLFAKKIPYLDIILLAGLYVLRIVAGSFATGIATSKWLFLFALCFFFSLAIVKRVTELGRLNASTMQSYGRGYTKSHSNSLELFGMLSGAVSIIVLGFYMQSPTISHLYGRPVLLWIPIAIICIWIARIWHLAFAKKLPHDPVLFATTDPLSYAAVALALACMFLAS